jgi:hypothetical protein
MSGERTALCALLERRVLQLWNRGLFDQMTANIENFGWWFSDEPRTQVTTADVCTHEPRCPK